MISSFLNRLLDLLAPRACTVCGNRLAIGEECICSVCNLHLPRTGYQNHADDNEMAHLFWGQIPLVKAAALFFYNSHSESSKILYSLKYFWHPEIGEFMGKMIAQEFKSSNFFNDIDMIVFVPLAKKRQHQRGYNQSHEIAKGVSIITGIPINKKAIIRTSFTNSQTNLGRWGRQENVKKVFKLKEADGLEGKHILIIDDVVTTGATIIACSNALKAIEGVKFSILSLGFAKG